MKKKPTPPFRPSARPQRPRAAKPVKYRFQLYVTGTSPRSTQAVTNIRTLCEEHLPGRYDLEVIDMYQQPGQAALGGIIAAPTLIKLFPAPITRIVGSLGDHDLLLAKLNLVEPPALSA